MAAAASALRIDVVADLVCPWCFIGVRRLEEALERVGKTDEENGESAGLAPTLAYHPFLLDPATPSDGVDLRAVLRKKYGGDPEAMFARVEAAARESGIPLDFAKVRRMVSTIGPHTLLRHASAKGTQRAFAMSLFEAYFLEGRDIGHPDTLASLASAQGFAADEALRLIRDEGERQRTRHEAEESERRGVEGVPFFMFGGRLAVSGAQPVKALVGAIDRARRELAE